MKIDDYGVKFVHPTLSKKVYADRELEYKLNHHDTESGPIARVYLHTHLLGRLYLYQDGMISLSGFNETIPIQWLKTKTVKEVYDLIRDISPELEKEIYLREIRIAYGIYA